MTLVFHEVDQNFRIFKEASFEFFELTEIVLHPPSPIQLSKKKLKVRLAKCPDRLSSELRQWIVRISQRFIQTICKAFGIFWSTHRPQCLHQQQIQFLFLFVKDRKVPFAQYAFHDIRGCVLLLLFSKAVQSSVKTKAF